MGADRRGPLAAFVIVALIAAILLVTSVRSQAAPWFSTRIVAGPATEPHLWGSVTGGVDQVVQEGTVLVRKVAQTSTNQRTRTDAVGASSTVTSTRHESRSTTHQAVRSPRTQPTTHRHHLAHGPADRPADQPADQPADEPADQPTGTPVPTGDEGTGVTPPQASSPGLPGHGLHLGWYEHHGHDEFQGPAESSDDSDAVVVALGAEHGNGHGQGLGHAFGRDRH